MDHSPLIAAVLSDDLPLVRLRLESRDDVNLRENNETALTWAAYKGRADMVRLLLERGADHSVKDGSGRTPLDLARWQNHPEVVRLLSPSPPSSSPPTPLKPPTLPAAGEQWVRLGSSAAAQVGTYPEAGRKLTHIFNFETRQHFLIAENMQTRAESTTPFASFDELPRRVLETALDEFEHRGGKADRDFVLDGTNILNKKKNISLP